MSRNYSARGALIGREVFQALLAALPLTHRELEALAAAKRDKRGGFDGRIFLEYTEQAPGIP